MLGTFLLIASLWCYGPSTRVPCDGLPETGHSSIWNNTTKTVTLSGGKGERLGFQIVIGPGVSYSNVRIAATNLYGPQEPAPANWDFLWERRILVDPQRPEVSSRLGVGLYRERLEPFNSFVIPLSTMKEVIFIKLKVPHVVAGDYSAWISLRANDEVDTIRVNLKIRNFTVQEPSTIMMVGLSIPKLNATVGPWQQTITSYMQMAADNDITLLVNGWQESLNWTDYRNIMGQWIPDAKRWVLPIPESYRLPYVASNDSLRVLETFRIMGDRWRQSGWPLDHAFAWIYDEPSLRWWAAYPEEVLAYAQAARAGNPQIRILVTDDPDTNLLPGLDILASRSDHFCRFGGIENWAYQSYDGGLPLHTIDSPGENFRLWPWISLKYGIPLFYWCGNFWYEPNPLLVADGQPEQYRDGNGVLFWPDTSDPENSALSSLRLEAISRGMQDVAIMEQLRQRSPLLYMSIMNRVVRSALSDGSQWTTSGDSLDIWIERARQYLSQ